MSREDAVHAMRSLASTLQHAEDEVGPDERQMRQMLREKLQTELLQYAQSKNRANLVAAVVLAGALDEPLPELTSEAWKIESLRMAIEMIEGEFLATGNPMFMIEAFLLARKIGDPVPEWVLSEITESFTDFYSSFQQFRKDGYAATPPHRVFSEAFGVKRSGPTIWSQRLTSEKRMTTVIGLRVVFKIQEWQSSGRPFNETAAVAEVAANSGISEQAAGNAWRDFKRVNDVDVKGLIGLDVSE